MRTGFLRRGGGCHWVDNVPYLLQDNTFYFTTPGQLLVQEEPQPLRITWPNVRRILQFYYR